MSKKYWTIKYIVPLISGGSLSDEARICLECGKVYSCYTSLRRHLRDTHAPPGIFNVVTCSFCNKNFKNKNSLANHKALYHKDPTSQGKKTKKDKDKESPLKVMGNLNKNTLVQQIENSYSEPQWMKKKIKCYKIFYHDK